MAWEKDKETEGNLVLSVYWCLWGFSGQPQAERRRETCRYCRVPEAPKSRRKLQQHSCCTAQVLYKRWGITLGVLGSLWSAAKPPLLSITLGTGPGAALGRQVGYQLEDSTCSAARTILWEAQRLWGSVKMDEPSDEAA